MTTGDLEGCEIKCSSHSFSEVRNKVGYMHFLGHIHHPLQFIPWQSSSGLGLYESDAARIRAIICCILDSEPIEEVQIRDPYTRSKEIKSDLS